MGALARVEGDTVSLEAFVGMPDGTRIVRDAASGSCAQAAALGERLLEAGGREILRALARQTA